MNYNTLHGQGVLLRRRDRRNHWRVPSLEPMDMRRVTAAFIRSRSCRPTRLPSCAFQGGPDLPDHELPRSSCGGRSPSHCRAKSSLGSRTSTLCATPILIAQTTTARLTLVFTQIKPPPITVSPLTSTRRPLGAVQPQLTDGCRRHQWQALVSVSPQIPKRCGSMEPSRDPVHHLRYADGVSTGWGLGWRI
jgi:hypothetical protein